MQVRVGPVDAGSVTMWVAYARTVLAQAMSRGDLDADTVERFEHYLDAWEAAADTHDDQVVWEGDVDAEEVEFLAHAFFRIADRLAAEATERGFPISPPEGDEFYQALVQGIIDGLAAQGRSLSSFSDQLRSDWPGLKEP